MTDTARQAAEARPASLPDLVLYTRPGCHLCDETRAVVLALLERRASEGAAAAPTLVERDISTNEAWEAAYGTTIPVLELGEQRLELATSPSRIARLLETLE